MYKPFLFLSLWVCPLFLPAQILEPLYKFTLHFEDARGNRDSVVMGFDSLAFPLYDPEFGKINIVDQPFDSVFEVRGATYGSEDFHSKLVVDGYYRWMCEDSYARYQMAILRAKYFPVVMRWDAGYFNQDCLRGSLITRSFGFILTPDFFDPKLTLLSENDSLSITREYLRYTDDGWLTTNVFDIEDGTRDTTYNLFVGISSGYPGVSSKDIPDLHLSLSPNPVAHTLRVQVPDTGSDDLWLVVSDVHGRSVSRQRVLSNQTTLLETGDWVPGCYFVHALDQAGRRRFAGKIMVQP